MAFPIPAHLPRRVSPQEVTAQILSRIDAATNKTLNAALATSWVSELDETIASIKAGLHERIQGDLPEFQRQWAAARSVQERLQVLTTNVDNLSDAVSNPENGLIPNLVRTLTTHAHLAQESTDSRVKYGDLSHLLDCRTSLRSLEVLVKEGKLSQAVGACREVEMLLQATPTHLNETLILKDVKRKFHVTQAQNDEQLSDVYARSIIISHLEADPSCHELSLHDIVDVRQADATIGLTAILASLSPSSLSSHLATLRRDLTNQFINTLTMQHVTTIVSSKASNHSFLLNSVTFDQENLTSRLENLSKFFSFLSNHLFLHIPPSYLTSFTRSLCKPTTTSILNNLLLPSLPRSFDLLSLFLELAQEVVVFEDKIIVGLLGNDANDRPLKAWVDGVSGHYERQRWTQILDRSREIIVASADPSDTFLVEVDSISTPSVVPVQDEDESSPIHDDARGFEDQADLKSDTAAEEAAKVKISPVKDDAWGFDDDGTIGADDTVDENGWGFDDDVPTEEEQDMNVSNATIHQPPVPPPQTVNGDDEPDPSDAWGWNEEDDVPPPTEESAWDDPWGDEPAVLPPESPSNSRPPAPSISKMATRLEKAANKGKRKSINGSSATPSPVLSQSPQLSHSTPSSATSLNGHQPKSSPQTHNGASLSATKQPSMLNMRAPPKETYVASGRSKLILRLIEDVLEEGKHLTSSTIFSALPPSQSSTPLGTTLLLAAPAALDLHRALYPVKFSEALQSAEEGMRFANDCAFLAGEVKRVKKGTTTLVDERLGECSRCLTVLSESWFHDVIAREQRALDATLTAGAQGFMYTGDQDRYDECESAMTQVLGEVRRVASRLKGILTKTKYYTAIGMVVEAALARILSDILALPDIPEVESHRLSELCHIFNAMEGLFVEDTTQPSFVVAYVPSWLKFSYLSELLEASMADITYLFEEGALVDFQVDELVRLVRALFADTQLRTNTITKLMGGHPAPRE
ncbi:hypothetical protein H0H87_007485 [Tephrocybe sp. NHM501043]|nr:hypothetical protein H0H87_007485 [Tephrocybe sp. NHM501043]